MRFPAGISTTLDLGGIAVTSNPRAARLLTRLHAEAQREHGRTAWRAPEILSWDGWLERLWHHGLRTGAESRLLLSRAQEHRLWVRIASPNIEGQRLISVDGVADLAQQAFALLCEYNSLDFLRGDIFGGIDIESFREWARKFESLCRQQGWASRSMLPLLLRDAILSNPQFQRASVGARPRDLVLIGFDRLTPAQRELLEVWKQAGGSWHFAENAAEESPVPAEAPVLIKTQNQREEISLCAQWIAGTLESAAGKRVRVAVLAADQGSMRREIERIFRRQLAPDTVAVSSQEASLPFEFSLGIPLTETPMVRSALMLLRWMEEGLRQEELSWLLLSGFLWRQESDLLPLAEFDAEMRRQGLLPLEQELESYLRRRGWNEGDARRGLRDRLFAARRIWREKRSEALSFAEWVERIETILTASGWPGPHRLRSEDFQLRVRWAKMLDTVAALGFDGQTVRFSEFLRVLEREARGTIFSPESHDAPVQILGPFEAAGMAFDALWFLGANDSIWPLPARPHPFLMQELQKQRGMPHADSNTDWELAKAATERIRASAAECIFSYSVQDKDGERRPSTVLASPKIVDGAQMREQLAFLDPEREFSPLPVEEEYASGITWNGQRSAGGYDVLKKQAACPFQAFAHFRLGARELNRADWGLDAMERGSLLHLALETLWEELKDHDSLVEARRSGELRTIVQRHVGNALVRYGTRREPGPDELPDTWSDAYLQAEFERVTSLLEDWLAYEEQRPPFTVEQHEKSIHARVGELDLKLRADRIDKVEGGRLIIDYKTGKISPASWEGDRPDEPQLPLYAAYGNVEDLRGVLFARVRAGDLKLEGSVADPEVIPERSSPQNHAAPPYSPELRRQWEKALLALSTQFVAGDAQVDPKSLQKTCKFCPYPGLCRVAETDRSWIDAGVDPESNGSNEEQDRNGDE